MPKKGKVFHIVVFMMVNYYIEPKCVMMGALLRQLWCIKENFEERIGRYRTYLIITLRK